MIMLTNPQKLFNKIQQIEEALSEWEGSPTKANKGSSHLLFPHDWEHVQRSTAMIFIHCQTGGSSQCNKSNRRQKDQKERSKVPLLTDIMIFYRENPKETAKESLELRSGLSVTPAAAHCGCWAAQPCPPLCDPTDGSPPGPPSLGFSRQEHWSGVPLPSPIQERKSESEVAESCPTLSDPMDCGLPGSSIHGIFQARPLELGSSSLKVKKRKKKRKKLSGFRVSSKNKVFKNVLQNTHRSSSWKLPNITEKN